MEGDLKMRSEKNLLPLTRWVLGGVLSLAGLLLLYEYDYPLFHISTELFSITIAFIIFVFAWNTRQMHSSQFLLFIGISFLFVGVFYLLHVLCSEGFIPVSGSSENISYQLWLIARCLGLLSIFGAFFFRYRALPLWALIIFLFLLSTGLFVSVFNLSVFPVCYIEGQGMTIFMRVSSVVLMILCSVTIILFFQFKNLLSRKILFLLIASLGITLLGDLSLFRFAKDMHRTLFINHYSRIIAFFLIYKAVIVDNLIKPYELLFFKIKEKTQSLESMNTNLDQLVQERTRDLIKAKEHAESNERLFKTLFLNSPDLVALVGLDGTFLDINKVAPEYRKEDVIGTNVKDFLNETQIQEYHRAVEGVLKTGDTQFYEPEIPLPGGGSKIWYNRISPLAENGQVKHFIINFTDVTDYREAQRREHQQAHLLELIFLHSLDSIVLLDKDYQFINVSQTYADSCGFERDFFTGKNHFELFPSSLKEEFDKVKMNKSIFQTKARPFLFPDHPEWGETYWDLGVVPILDADEEIEYFLFTLKDVTSEIRGEQELESTRNAVHESKNQVRQTLDEKNILLKELLHRTKNNMQVISSILQMKRLFTDNDQVKAEFQEAENKIYTMALVHRLLYQSKSLSYIHTKEFIEELVDLLAKSYSIDCSMIRIFTDIEDCDIIIDIASPFGLVLNELISNIFKHAFPGGKGDIHISLKKEENRIFLNVRDTGIGVPSGFDFFQTQTLGLQTIISIVQKQLYGSIEFDVNGGVACSIQFQDNLYSVRV